MPVLKDRYPSIKKHNQKQELPKMEVIWRKNEQQHLMKERVLDTDTRKKERSYCNLVTIQERLQLLAMAKQEPKEKCPKIERTQVSIE